MKPHKINTAASHQCTNNTTPSHSPAPVRHVDQQTLDPDPGLQRVMQNSLDGICRPEGHTNMQGRWHTNKPGASIYYCTGNVKQALSSVRPM